MILNLIHYGLHSFYELETISGAKFKKCAFDGCYKLNGIDASEITEINDYSFSYNHKNEFNSLPNSRILINTYKDTTSYNNGYGASFNECYLLTRDNFEIEFAENSTGRYLFFNSGIEGATITFSGIQNMYYMFSECKNLENISFRNSFNTGSTGYMFMNCNKLKTINIPNNSIIFGNSHYMFCNCTKLETVNLNNLTTAYLPERMFGGCINLEKIIYNNQENVLPLPTASTKIGEYFLYNCSKIQEITIPNGITRIDQGAFQDCISLETINIPLTCTEFGTEAFKNTKFLNDMLELYNYFYINNIFIDGTQVFGTLAVPESITVFADGAFKDNQSIRTVYLPSGATEISTDLFRNCQNLERVEIPSGVNKIGNYAFYDCRSLSEVILPDSLEVIGDYAFYCNADENRGLKSINIPNNVTEIGEYAFAYQRNPELRISIPDSVMSFKDGCFYRISQETLDNFEFKDRSMREIPFRATIFDRYSESLRGAFYNDASDSHGNFIESSHYIPAACDTPIFTKKINGASEITVIFDNNSSFGNSNCYMQFWSSADESRTELVKLGYGDLRNKKLVINGDSINFSVHTFSPGNYGVSYGYKFYYTYE